MRLLMILLFAFASIEFTNADDYKFALFNVLRTQEEFHDGLAVYRDPESGLYGYMGTNGKISIAAKYLHCDDFIKGQAIVKEKTGYGIINTHGDYLLPPYCSVIEQKEEAEGLYLVKDASYKNGLFYNNRIVIPLQKDVIDVADFPFINNSYTGGARNYLNIIDGKSYTNIMKIGNIFVTKKEPQLYFDRNGVEIKNPTLVSKNGLEVFTDSASGYCGLRHYKTKNIVVPAKYICLSKVWQDNCIIMDNYIDIHSALFDSFGNIIRKTDKSCILNFISTTIGNILWEHDYNSNATTLYTLKGNPIVTSKGGYVRQLYDTWFVSMAKDSDDIYRGYLYDIRSNTKILGKHFKYSDDMICIEDNDGKYYFINASTGKKLPGTYNSAYNFSEGLAVVDRNKIIDKSGRIVLSANDKLTIRGDRFSEGVISVDFQCYPCYVFNPLQNNHFVYNQEGIGTTISDSYFSEGNRLMNNGSYAEAKEIFYMIMMNDPNNSNAINNYGVCLDNMGYKEEALETFRIAYDLNHNNSTAYNNIKILEKSLITENRNNRSNTFWNALASFGNLLVGFSNSLSNSAMSFTTSTNDWENSNEILSPNEGENSSESSYITQYKKWENTAERHYNSITNLGYRAKDKNNNRSGGTLSSMNGGNYVRMKQQFRDAQRQMRNIRINARNKGINIPQSKWETATIVY